MFQTILKAIPALFFWGIFIYVIFFVPYPESLTQADLFQLLSFFIPLFLSLIFTINILIRSILLAIIISFGAIILLVLKALDSLNLVSAILTILAVILLFSYFRKSPRLTSIPKLHKLTRKRHP